MFGIDLGITVSSVVCAAGSANKYAIIDYTVLHGNKHEPDEWVRIIDMSDAIVTSVTEICKSQPDVHIEPLVSIEEPVLPWGTRNPKSYFNMCCLYALTRNKLTVRGFTVYSINPMSVKSTAKAMAFRGKKLKKVLAVRGRLTKKGMVRAFTKVTGKAPDGTNNITRETIADAFFIAQTGIDRRKLGVK